MDLDKNWYRGGVAADIYRDLIRKEHELFYYCDYVASKHLLPLRRRVVDWMLDVNKRMDDSRFNRHRTNCNHNHHHILQSSLRSMHLAVYLFDYFLYKHNVSSEHIYLIAASTIIAAAKFEILHSNVPLPKVMNQFIQADQRRTYKLNDYRRAERMLLKSTDWRFHVPLAIDFINYYLVAFENVDTHSAAMYGRNRVVISPPTVSHHSFVEQQFSSSSLSFSCRYPTPSPEPSDGNFSDWKNLAEFLLNYTLKDISFRQFKPSLVAGAAIYAARFYYAIKPYWTKKLTEISRYTLEDLDGCFNNIVRMVDIERRHNPSAFPSSFNGLFGTDNSTKLPGYSFSPAASPDLEIIGSSPNFETPSNAGFRFPVAPQSSHAVSSLLPFANTPAAAAAATSGLPPSAPQPVFLLMNDQQTSSNVVTPNLHTIQQQQRVVTNLATVPIQTMDPRSNVATQQQQQQQQQHHHQYSSSATETYLIPVSSEATIWNETTGSFKICNLFTGPDGRLICVLKNNRLAPIISFPLSVAHFNRSTAVVPHPQSLDVIDLEPSPHSSLAGALEIPSSIVSSSISSNTNCHHCYECTGSNAIGCQGQQRAQVGAFTRSMKRALSHSGEVFGQPVGYGQHTVKRTRRK